MDNPFWQFSVKKFSLPEIQQQCLAWQSEYAININLILLGCWMGEQGIALNETDFMDLEQQVSEWRNQVVLPLRRIRGYLKSQTSNEMQSLRQAIATQELASEHIEQNILYKAIQARLHTATQTHLTLQNLTHYFYFHLQKEISPTLYKALETFSQM